MIYEIIDQVTRVVINSIEWDGVVGNPIPSNCTAAPRDKIQGSGVGWTYVNGQFIRPPAPPPPPIVVPTLVSRFQARAAMAQAGYFTQVDDFMAALPKTDIRRLAWEDATEFDRTSTTLQAMQQMLGLTDKQVDDLFILAKTIEA